MLWLANIRATTTTVVVDTTTETPQQSYNNNSHLYEVSYDSYHRALYDIPVRSYDVSYIAVLNYSNPGHIIRESIQTLVRGRLPLTHRWPAAKEPLCTHHDHGGHAHYPAGLWHLSVPRPLPRPDSRGDWNLESELGSIRKISVRKLNSSPMAAATHVTECLAILAIGYIPWVLKSHRSPTRTRHRPRRPPVSSGPAPFNNMPGAETCNHRMLQLLCHKTQAKVGSQIFWVGSLVCGLASPHYKCARKKKTRARERVWKLVPTSFSPPHGAAGNERKGRKHDTKRGKRVSELRRRRDGDQGIGVGFFRWSV